MEAHGKLCFLQLFQQMAALRDSVISIMLYLDLLNHIASGLSSRYNPSNIISKVNTGNRANIIKQENTLYILSTIQHNMHSMCIYVQSINVLTSFCA